MKEIEHIGFPTLKLLNVSGNFIYSIEGFHQIFLPNLKKFWIEGLKDPSFLLSISPLKKVDWPDFTSISIGKKLVMKMRIGFKRERALA